MSNPSKAKGNSFERQIAKILSEQYEYLYGPNSSQRNISSGSMYGGSNKIRANDVNKDFIYFASDIICPNAFKYVIECKFYKTPPSINSIITQNNSQWDKWVKQVENDADSAGKSPMLIIKYNDVKPFVLIKDRFDNIIFNYKEYFAYDFNEFINNNKKRLINVIDLS